MSEFSPVRSSLEYSRPPALTRVLCSRQIVAPVMSDSLREFVEHLPIVDVHEHHLPEVILQPDVNLLQLFQQSYAGWTQARPYCLPSETRDADPMLAAAGPTTWAALTPFLEQSGSSFFVRNLVRAVVELHGQEIGRAHV